MAMANELTSVNDGMNPMLTPEVMAQMSHVRQMKETCPYCGHCLYQTSVDGEHWGPGICTNVGEQACPVSYRSPDGAILRAYMQGGVHSTATGDTAKRARWSDAVNFMRGHSIYPTSGMSSKDLNNWRADTPEQGEALKLAQAFVRDVVAGKTRHMLLMGHTGSGKSHIANGAMKAIGKQSDFRQRVYFVSWPDFCAAAKQGINKDAQERRKLADRIKKAWRTNAVVVIDDLGAEDATPFTKDLVNQMAYALDDRSCIITTNQPWPALISRYGDRVTRRLLNHRDKYLIRLNQQFGEPISAEQMRILGM